MQEAVPSAWVVVVQVCVPAGPGVTEKVTDLAETGSPVSDSVSFPDRLTVAW